MRKYNCLSDGDVVKAYNRWINGPYAFNVSYYEQRDLFDFVIAYLEKSLDKIER